MLAAQHLRSFSSEMPWRGAGVKPFSARAFLQQRTVLDSETFMKSEVFSQNFLKRRLNHSNTQIPTVFVPCGCCNARPHNQWQDNAKSFPYSSVGRRSGTGLAGLGSRHRAVFLSGSPRETSEPLLFQLPGLPTGGAGPWFLPPSSEPATQHLQIPLTPLPLLLLFLSLLPPSYF